MERAAIKTSLTDLGDLTARRGAFLIVLLYALGWLALSPETLEWHGVATLATWLMTLVIQRAEHRDTQALHAKMDELLRTQAGARNDLASLDEQEPEEVERHRDANAAGRPAKPDAG